MPSVDKRVPSQSHPVPVTRVAVGVSSAGSPWPYVCSLLTDCCVLAFRCDLWSSGFSCRVVSVRYTCEPLTHPGFHLESSGEVTMGP